MDPKQIGIGAIAVAALAVAVGGAVSSKDVVAVSAGEADVAVTEIVKASDEVKNKTCTREWVTVRVKDGPKLVWLCDGAYLPAQQAWLDKTAGEDGMRVELTPRDDGKGGIVVDATVHKGEPPVYQPPEPEPAKAEAVEEIKEP